MSSIDLAILKRVEFLAPLDDVELEALASVSRTEVYRSGSRIVSELEFGADVFVILEGEAEVSVEPRRGERHLLSAIGPGSAVGEMSSLTGALRSATVRAKGRVEVLRIPDRVFDQLRERRPQVAAVLVRVLAKRLADAEKSADALFLAAAADEPTFTPTMKGSRGSVGRAWREMVTGRGKDLAFLALVGFVVTILLVRAVVAASFHFDVASREILRVAYVGGFALLGCSACASLFTFRPAWRRAIAIAYGVACALIANELGVTLAFDIFYKDIHTADPDVAFNIERLYRRTEALRAIGLGFVVLLQLAYLRGFYRRALFVLTTRLRRFVSKR